MSICIYQSIYRKKEFPDILHNAPPLLNIYSRNQNYHSDKENKYIGIKCEEMFYLKMVRGKKINFNNLWNIIENNGTKKYDILHDLLKCDCMIDIKSPDNGDTLLIIATQRQNILIIERLINAKISIDAWNNNGHTALMTVSGHNFRSQSNIDSSLQKIAETLIRARCNLDAEDNDGHTALTWASAVGRVGIVDQLIGAKCNLNIEDKCKNTALILASRRGHLGIVEKLISAKCTLDNEDNDGDTALVNAQNNGYRTIVKKLIDAGCKVDMKFYNKYMYRN